MDALAIAVVLCIGIAFMLGSFVHSIRSMIEEPEPFHDDLFDLDLADEGEQWAAIHDLAVRVAQLEGEVAP
jgi:hypothetical protein